MPPPNETTRPRAEREHVALLAPESPVMFARARHILRDLTRDGAARFLVGAVDEGCWSVLRGEDGWRAVHWPGGSAGADEATDHATAREATAHAVAGLLAEEGVSVHSGILELAGLIRLDPPTGAWGLTDTGRRVRDESANSARPAGTSCIALEAVTARAGYFVTRPGPPPSEGPFVDVRTVLSMAAFAGLPEPPDDPGEARPVDLPVDTALDGYGDDGEVFLFEPGTPFNRRGLWGEPEHHRHRRYRVRKPLRGYPSFPFEQATIDVERTGREGRGYYLVDTIAALLAAGTLSETTERP
ncbi:glycohydrolase toxin TNT-related protein [Actinomadura sp. 7K534]|uniref:glycohydrolase toxin TNT-related protein n=1 Tax=Actinomadura sp. 7K534 TaxID=2530366 RepID=UPI001044E272|nr:glycohydrolase toxin TNT-related protein [Actinomadura sp. 7K534]TDB85758.1 DUF4237 domain-containing protein [Actinomadura sp. 7K534]